MGLGSEALIMATRPGYPVSVSGMAARSSQSVLACIHGFSSPLMKPRLPLYVDTERWKACQDSWS